MPAPPERAPARSRLRSRRRLRGAHGRASGRPPGRVRARGPRCRSAHRGRAGPGCVRAPPGTAPRPPRHHRARRRRRVCPQRARRRCRRGTPPPRCRPVHTPYCFRRARPWSRPSPRGPGSLRELRSDLRPRCRRRPRATCQAAIVVFGLAASIRSSATRAGPATSAGTTIWLSTSPLTRPSSTHAR